MRTERKEPLAGYRDLLGVEDLCAIFGVSKQTIYNEIRRGKFGETVRIGRAHKVPKQYVIRTFMGIDD